MTAGIITLSSPYSVPDTLDRLESILRSKNITIFTRVDHSGEAEKAGLHMPPTQLLIFGNPKGGTPIMLAAPLSAIDLPAQSARLAGPPGQRLPQLRRSPIPPAAFRFSGRTPPTHCRDSNAPPPGHRSVVGDYAITRFRPSTTPSCSRIPSSSITPHRSTKRPPWNFPIIMPRTMIVWPVGATCRKRPLWMPVIL